MLNIFLSEEISDEVIVANDYYFDLNLSKIKFDDKVLELIERIDGVRYDGDHTVFSKFHKGVVVRVEELSTGCKTAINVYSFPKKIFYAGGCGDNALQQMYDFKKGNICINYFSIPVPFQNEIRVKTNKKDTIVTNNRELEKVMYKFFDNEDLL